MRKVNQDSFSRFTETTLQTVIRRGTISRWVDLTFEIQNTNMHFLSLEYVINNIILIRKKFSVEFTMNASKNLEKRFLELWF